MIVIVDGAKLSYEENLQIEVKECVDWVREYEIQNQNEFWLKQNWIYIGQSSSLNSKITRGERVI